MARRRKSWPGSWLSVLLAACGGDGGGAAATAVTLGPATTGMSATDGEGPGTDGPSSSSSDPEEESEGSSSGGPEPIDCGAMMQCGATCVDLTTDPNNCGSCGVSCVIANAEAVCVAMECGLGECLPGWSDCDGDLANGCEAQAECNAGAACDTTCGSPGVIACSATCEPTCTTLAETCNAVDDDCNEMCDEGMMAGCRVGVHRSNHATLGHFYTIDLMEAQSNGFVLEAQNFYWLYVAEAEGLVALNRCLRPNGKRFYTASGTCEGAGTLESALGFMSPDERCGGIPLYRLYHGGNDAHFYTTSAAERDNAVANLGWTYEAVTGWVWAGA